MKIFITLSLLICYSINCVAQSFNTEDFFKNRLLSLNHPNSIITNAGGLQMNDLSKTNYWSSLKMNNSIGITANVENGNSLNLGEWNYDQQIRKRNNTNDSLINNVFARTNSFQLIESQRLNMQNALTYNEDITLDKHVPGIRLLGRQINGRDYTIYSGIIGINNAGFSIRDNTSSSTLFSIYDNGNVGIGSDIDNGLDKLQVTGTIKTNQLKVKKQASNLNTMLSIEDTYTVANSESALDWKNSEYFWDMARISTKREGSASNFSLLFSTGYGGSLNERLRINSYGNVGIGTSTPDEKLTVKGKIHAQEVKVDLSVPGPDYVFNEDYELTPLSEIQSYIKINKHLPEVPSAKEMETNGINLSEMNMLLLKKVEELTLHLIEKDKEIILINEKLKTIEKNINK